MSDSFCTVALALLSLSSPALQAQTAPVNTAPVTSQSTPSEAPNFVIGQPLPPPPALNAPRTPPRQRFEEWMQLSPEERQRRLAERLAREAQLPPDERERLRQQRQRWRARTTPEPVAPSAPSTASVNTPNINLMTAPTLPPADAPPHHLSLEERRALRRSIREAARDLYPNLPPVRP